ncbi:adp-Ribosyl-[Dinitrogen reductase] hydrolase [Arthrobacter sp. Hiyo1]|nr:adp-Ribosyl-[Dinitrogen reductase] hydrolase [Arthrobacter sp. Hiyo1]
MSAEPSPSAVPSFESRVNGCLLGGALGDSLGYAVEFDDVATIRTRFGAAGLTSFGQLDGGTHFSDDTQMTLYTVDGLVEALEWANDGVAADETACLWLAYLRCSRARASRCRHPPPFPNRGGSTAKKCSGTAGTRERRA